MGRRCQSIHGRFAYTHIDLVTSSQLRMSPVANSSAKLSANADDDAKADNVLNSGEFLEHMLDRMIQDDKGVSKPQHVQRISGTGNPWKILHQR